MSERDNIGGRVRRYARVGAAVGGLAARAAGTRYLGIGLDRERHAADLTAALGGLKGPLMKVAQILSTVPDILPSEYAERLSELQSNAPPMGGPFVARRMASELGPDWENKFAGFERQAAAAASLGQVHRATSHDGKPLACKLQYPDMRSVVEADLRQLRLAFAIFERYDPVVDTRNIHAELSVRLREELDYDRELHHMRLYGAMLADEADVHVPEIHPELSSDRLLTMGWLDGEPLMDLAEGPARRRNKVARNLFRAWYVPFYRYGIIHGDPHLGNYTARPDGGVNLLDFGCIRIFPPSFVQGVIDLYNAIDRGEKALAVHAYESWGFTGLSQEIIDVLNLWAEFVYAPLMDDRVRPIQINHEGGPYGAKVAAKVHTELRRLGGVAPPREFVLMDRAAIGLGSVFLRLGAKLNWHRLFHDLIDDFDLKTVTRRQKAALEAAGVPEAK